MHVRCAGGGGGGGPAYAHARPTQQQCWFPPARRPGLPRRPSIVGGLGLWCRGPQVPRLSVSFVMCFPLCFRDTPLFLFHRVVRVVHFSNNLCSPTAGSRQHPILISI
jgi:hypothetical protein